MKEWEPPEVNYTDALNFAQNNGAVVKHYGNKAFFRPSEDTITMPPQKNFGKSVDYERVLLHELTHWSGHKDRLAREFSGRFGDESYAFEELIAEMGSAFLLINLGMRPEILQHTAYIQSWIKVLKEDKRAIFTASSQARKASEGLLEFQWAEENLEEQAA